MHAYRQACLSLDVAYRDQQVFIVAVFEDANVKFAVFGWQKRLRVKRSFNGCSATVNSQNVIVTYPSCAARLTAFPALMPATRTQSMPV